MPSRKAPVALTLRALSAKPGLSTFDAFTESYAGVRLEQRELFELIDLVWPGEDDPELPYA